MATTMTAVCSGGLLGPRAAAPRSAAPGRTLVRSPFGSLSGWEAGAIALYKSLEHFCREQDRLDRLRPKTPARRLGPSAPTRSAAPSHPVLYGVAALTGVRSARTDPSTPYVSSYHLRFARGAFGDAPGVGVTRTAWLSTGYDKWESVGIPRFTAQGSFLRFELPCVTARAKELAAHVRSGGFLHAAVDFASLDEHTEGRTRVVDRARACGVLLTVGPGSTGFPLSMVQVRG